GGSGLQQARGERVFLADRHGDDLDIRIAAQQLSSGFKPADARHLDVHQDDIRLEFARLSDGLLARVSLAYHLQAIDIDETPVNACAYQVIIIDDYHPI